MILAENQMLNWIQIPQRKLEFLHELKKMNGFPQNKEILDMGHTS